MLTLTVLYDPECGLCRRAHGWLADQSKLVEMAFVPCASEEARRRFPFLGKEVTSSRFRAGDGWLDPVRLTTGFAIASGAEVCAETEVTGLAIEGGAVAGVKTTRGEISTRVVVIAGGPFVPRLAAMVGLRVPIVLMTRHKVFVPSCPEAPSDAPMTIEGTYQPTSWTRSMWPSGCFSSARS